MGKGIMMKVLLVCFATLFVCRILSNPVREFRKEAPTTRLYSEGTREVLRSAAPLSAPVDPGQGILRGLDQGYVPFRVR
jgi:hypothetical protein